MSDIEDVAKVVLLTLGAEKVLAAPATAVGEHIRDRIKRRLDATLTKARDKGMGEPMSDRVAFKVLNEAAFTDDELTLEYLAGVIAATGPTDDTGAAVVAQIGRLSAAQLRLHYILYREIRRLWPTYAPMNLYEEDEAAKAGVRIPRDDLMSALGSAQVGNILAALLREGLVHGEYRFGPTPDGNWSIEVRPSASGAELFLWGQGSKVWNARALLLPTTDLTPLAEVPDTPNATLIDPPAPPDAEGQDARTAAEPSDSPP